MACRSPFVCRLLLFAALVFTYFVLFPTDLAALLAPLELVLELFNSISPWLYGLVAVCILAWTTVRIWGSGVREP